MTGTEPRKDDGTDQAAVDAATALEDTKRPARLLHAWLQSRWFLLLFKLTSPRSFGQILLLNLYAYVLAFVTKWGLAWGLLALLAPDWMLPGDAAMTTIGQVLPALMVSVFVFILGSFFVVTQLATSIHSNRASILLLRDARVQQAVARPLVISLFTLGLALLSPQNTDQAVAALAVVLVAGTAFTLINAATLLPYLISSVTAPRNFVLYVLEDVELILTLGDTHEVVYRVGVFGEMLQRGVRTPDLLQVIHALGGFEQFHQAYVRAAKLNPAARVHQYEQAVEEGWLAEELVPPLVAAAQEAIGLEIDNHETNRIAIELARFGIRSAEAEHRREFDRAADGLAQMGTCTQQMKWPPPTPIINLYTEPVYGLACLVRDGTAHLGPEAGARALANWALVIGYAIQHLGANIDGIPGHIYWLRSLELFPDDTPWNEAHDYVDTPDFQNGWAGQATAIRAVFAPLPENAGEGDEPELLFPGGALAVHQYIHNAMQQHTALQQG